jgi:hypothetical protein
MYDVHCPPWLSCIKDISPQVEIKFTTLAKIGTNYKHRLRPVITVQYLRSESGNELVNDELVDVILLIDGLGPPIPCMKFCCIAVVCATHAEGSIGRTGSCRGTVKYPLGLGSQHLATTRVIGL